MATPKWVQLCQGVPTAEFFTSLRGQGTPIIVDTTTNTPYYLKAGVVTAFAGGGGGGYSLVEDEGTPLTARTTMNFVGAGVTAADSGGKTVVTIPGGGAGGGIPLDDVIALEALL